MAYGDYRIESNQPLAGRLWPLPGAQDHLFSDRSLAVAMAAKSLTSPSGQEIRVVHVPSGEIVFRKTAAERAQPGDEP